MPKGFPGMGNMNNVLKQVQKMQQEIQKLQEEVKDKTVEASAGGGAVVAVANGKKELVEIKIDESATEDIEMLQDLVLAAVNEALRKADEMVSSEMGKITAGLNIPGFPGIR
ncbi:YbaB/EbfC family nucleoid-associated protein [Caldanaerobius polysaccharolyticus]|uniref:YbaB/EbfC family nucleoid-associated protein n=1 Tax=Caldanaerobius polysaccharolyticus TaxID=44256 RepID=UPI00047ED2FB|nr:YbaB/EbfC family nucleoid-associated protein [Caldanaerobius polysaccharolyticus]